MQKENSEDGKAGVKIKYVVEKFRKGEIEALLRSEKIRTIREEKRAE